MINRLNADYSMFGDKSNYCPRNEFIKFKFIELCNIILYSNNEIEKQKAYNIIFREYRNYIKLAAKEIRVSVFEDVICKLLEDTYENTYGQNGEKYSPFERFVSIIRDQKETKKRLQYSSIINTKEFLHDDPLNPLSNLEKYLVYCILSDNTFNDAKRKCIQIMLQKNLCDANLWKGISN